MFTILDARQVELREQLDNLGLPAATVKEILTALDGAMGQLKVKPESPISKRVVITASDFEKSIGGALALTSGEKLVSFAGAVINFSTGQIFEADGTTLISTFTPQVLSADQYFYYAVSLQVSTLNADNTVKLEPSVSLAASANVDQNLAPKANFDSGSPVAQILVQANDVGTDILDLDWDSITQVSFPMDAGSAQALDEHIASSEDVHGIGAGSEVVGTATAQTLTNKTLDGASIQNPTQLDAKKDTKANLETYAITATNGQLVFATDTKEMFQVLDGLLVPVGSGQGGGGGSNVPTQSFRSTFSNYVVPSGFYAVVDFFKVQNSQNLGTNPPSSSYDIFPLVVIDSQYNIPCPTETGIQIANSSAATYTFAVDPDFGNSQIISVGCRVRRSSGNGTYTANALLTQEGDPEPVRVPVFTSQTSIFSESSFDSFVNLGGVEIVVSATSLSNTFFSIYTEPQNNNLSYTFQENTEIQITNAGSVTAQITLYSL